MDRRTCTSTTYSSNSAPSQMMMMMMQDPPMYHLSPGQVILCEADQILEDQTVYKVPSSGSVQWFSVSSFSSDKPHQVAVKGTNGGVCCNCEGWKAHKCCAHAVAVVQKKGMLSNYLDWYTSKHQKNITSSINMNVKKQALGRKAKKKTNFQGTEKEKHQLSSHRKKSLPKDRSKHYKYALIFLSELTAYNFYGCDSIMCCPPGCQIHWTILH
ncbi:hypothetical protein OS493_020830 [Desmophyllum pertusum]|uniref:SWIM-type domain-containing protein n=1 Tax=Desmophyllum pertusum TaxID=174260 RepID=A0A9W9YB87_9CNID|nr:hypothetical protein OS493_020830 [Desmophyllum pertusum]